MLSDEIKKIAETIKIAKLDLKNYLEAEKNIENKLDDLHKRRKEYEELLYKEYQEIKSNPTKIKIQLSVEIHNALIKHLSKSKYGVKTPLIKKIPNNLSDLISLGVGEIKLGDKAYTRSGMSEITFHFDNSSQTYMIKGARKINKYNLSKNNTIGEMIKNIDELIKQGFFDI